MVSEQSPRHLRALKPNRKRITLALDLRALYGPEVDQALGVEEPTVDRWESGDEVPTPAQVMRIAALTGFPVGFFYRQDDPPEFTSGFICSRTRGGCQPLAETRS